MFLTTYYAITLLILTIALLIFVYQLSSLEESVADLRPISITTPLSRLERMSRATLNTTATIIGPRLNRIEDGFTLFQENKTIFITEIDENVTFFEYSLLCAVESTLRTNPHFNVAIITASKQSIENAPLFLSWFNNVTIHLLDVSNFLKSSQVSSWYEEQQQLSLNARDLVLQIDRILKFILLYNYGGIYMDADAFAVGSFLNSPSDFVVPYDFNRIASSFMRISKFHPLLNKTLNLAIKPMNVNCTDFDLITMATMDFCSKGNHSLPFLNRQCSGDLQILPIKTAFPIRPRSICELYESHKYYNILRMARHKYALVLRHFASRCKIWLNRAGISDEINLDNPFLRLMQEHCPYCERNVLEKAIGFSWLNLL